MNASVEPILARPGAGLPAPELFIARVNFKFRRLTGGYRSSARKFDREREQIRKLIKSCPPERAAQRVLIARPAGLEDSSRYWSIWMTLDHLRIVNTQVARVITSLMNGETLPGQASTAAVKPGAEAGESSLHDFEHACDTLVRTAGSYRKLASATRFAHPWFGLLDAAGWHALAAGHMKIHRVQIQRILEGLDQSGC